MAHYYLVHGLQAHAHALQFVICALAKNVNVNTITDGVATCVSRDALERAIACGPGPRKFHLFSVAQSAVPAHFAVLLIRLQCFVTRAHSKTSEQQYT